ncbi:MAG: glutamine amidotransferase [Candidatus Sumerlaeia bacterium]
MLLQFNPPFSSFLFVIIVAIAFVMPALLVFRSSSIRSRRMQWLLFCLRLCAVLLLVIVLANPVRRIERETPKLRDQHVFLVDTSESMSLEKPEARLAQVRKIIQPVLRSGEFAANTHLFKFDTDLKPPVVNDQVLTMMATGPVTHLGESLASLLEATSDPELLGGIAGIYVCSDGQLHDREYLGEAVRLATRYGVPVSAIPAGSDRKIFNAAIQNCLVDRQAPPQTELPVRVLVKAQDTSSQTATLTLTDKRDQIVAQKEFVLSDGISEQELLIETGSISSDYSLRLTPMADEAVLIDNNFDFRVDIVHPRIRVLYMEGSNHPDPNWRDVMEYELMEQAFLETGNIDVEVFTVDIQMGVGGRLYNVRATNEGYPETREELYKFDVVICSDINRFIFSEEQLEWTRDLVSERGGGFCMIGGHTSFGAGGWDRTVWEQLIPVDMETFGAGYVEQIIYPNIPEEAREHPIWQIVSDPAENEEILETHPPFRGTNLVNRAKPAATVLARHPSFSDMPMICVQPYGKGRSMAFTSDAAGGWGSDYQTEWGEGSVGLRDNRYYRQFWVNAVRWLAANSLNQHGVQLIANTEAASYRPGDMVKLRCTLAAPDVSEARNYRVTARLVGLAGPEAILNYSTDTGEYEGSILLPEEIDRDDLRIMFRADPLDSGKVLEDELPLRIIQVAREFDDLDPDHEVLAELAEATDGRVIGDEGELEAVMRKNLEEQQKNKRVYTAPLWDNFWLWAVILALFSAEWFLRKMYRYS